MKQLDRRLATICAVALVLSACSKTPAPVVSAPPPPPVVSTPVAPDPREEAVKEPTADYWNDLSYAQLLAGKYEDALSLAKRALELDKNHAGAQYNAGMAALEIGTDLTAAARWLDQSARAQPDRYQPLIGLARLAVAGGRADVAGEYLKLARQLPGGEVVAAKLEPQADQAPALVPAPTACDKQLTDGPNTLCLAKGEKGYELFLLQGQGMAQHRAIGQAPQVVSFEKGALPDGTTAYWLQIDGAVDLVDTFYGFVVRDGSLRQIIFKGGTDVDMSYLTTWVKSSAAPRVLGDELTVSHRFEPDPQKFVTMRFRFLPGSLVAEQTFFFQSIGNK